MPFDMYKLIGITFWLITLVAAYWYGGENVQRADLPNELVKATGFDVDSHDFKPTSGGKPLSINPKESLDVLITPADKVFKSVVFVSVAVIVTAPPLSVIVILEPSVNASVSDAPNVLPPAVTVLGAVK